MRSEMEIYPNKSLRKREEEWGRMLELSSIPLQKLGADNLPAGLASGCLCEFEGHRLLLTVGHIFRDENRWGMVVKYIPGKGTELFPFDPMIRLAWVDSDDNKIEDIDLAFVAVPKNKVPLYQEIDENKFSIVSEATRTVHVLDFETSPRMGAWYGFAGDTKPIF